MWFPGGIIIFVSSLLLSIECQGIENTSSFIIYFNGGTTTYTFSSVALLLTNSNFDDGKPTVFYFYGLTQTKDTKEVVGIRNAYLSNGDYNFVLYDLEKNLYTLTNQETIGRTVATGLLPLFDAGLSSSRVEFVGFSLGAEVAGSVARNLNSKSLGRHEISRIVGLDPAILTLTKLRSGDASFVMTVHTEIILSNPLVVGDAAFWVNGGIRQPMCTYFIIFHDAICSHLQAQLYWTEAVLTKSETIFPARKCSDYGQFFWGKCDPSETIGFMNPKASTSLRGNYFLNTNLRSPFSMATADP